MAVAALVALSLPATPATAATSDDVRTASIALAHEAADLVALHAFPSSGQQQALDAALQGLPLGDHPTSSQLRADDRAGAQALSRLTAGHLTVSREVRTVLGQLTSAQLTAIGRGRSLTEPQAGVYLEALDDLTSRNAAPPTAQGARPDPQRVQAALATVLQVGGPGPGPSSGPPAVTRPPAAPSSSSRWPWAVGIAVLAVGGVLWARRRPAPKAVPLGLTRPLPTIPQQGVAVHSVLDASRRLTMLTADDDMPRAVIREVLSLVPGRAAALIERQGDDLVLVHESQPDLLQPQGFAHGVIDTAANAGRVLAQLVTADPSFTRQPVQALLLPLVSAGRVDAVVVVVRDATQVFTPAERELLATFAPVAASARELAARTQAAVDASQLDPLTGAGNRRQLEKHLEVVLREGAGGSTGFFMIDLDHFKRVNDTYGHPAGDAMLRNVCATIRAAVRPTDGVYRYGGEEFCVLLPSTDLTETHDIAERVRAAVAGASYDVGVGQLLSATASVGIAATGDTDGDALISRADRALYQAKAGGRNQVSSG